MPRIFDVNVVRDGVVVGTTQATYWTDPVSQNIYTVPVGYNPQDTINRFNEPFDRLDPSAASDKDLAQLTEYRTGGPLDMQQNFNGDSYGGFVKEFTPIASFDYGLAAHTSGLDLRLTELAGGAWNEHNSWSNPHIDTSGAFYNNPNNVPNIENGFNFYQEYTHGINAGAPSSASAPQPSNDSDEKSNAPAAQSSNGHTGGGAGGHASHDEAPNAHAAGSENAGQEQSISQPAAQEDTPAVNLPPVNLPTVPTVHHIMNIDVHHPLGGANSDHAASAPGPQSSNDPNGGAINAHSSQDVAIGSAGNDPIASGNQVQSSADYAAQLQQNVQDYGGALSYEDRQLIAQNILESGVQLDHVGVHALLADFEHAMDHNVPEIGHYELPQGYEQAVHEAVNNFHGAFNDEQREGLTQGIIDNARETGVPLEIHEVHNFLTHEVNLGTQENWDAIQANPALSADEKLQLFNEVMNHSPGMPEAEHTSTIVDQQVAIHEIDTHINDLSTQVDLAHHEFGLADQEETAISEEYQHLSEQYETLGNHLAAGIEQQHALDAAYDQQQHDIQELHAQQEAIQNELHEQVTYHDEQLAQAEAAHHDVQYWTEQEQHEAQIEALHEQPHVGVDNNDGGYIDAPHVGGHEIDLGGGHEFGYDGGHEIGFGDHGMGFDVGHVEIPAYDFPAFDGPGDFGDNGRNSNRWQQHIATRQTQKQTEIISSNNVVHLGQKTTRHELTRPLIRTTKMNGFSRR